MVGSDMLAPERTASASTDDTESLQARLTTSVCQFAQRLATQRSGCLAQVWVPGLRDDGEVTLHTQVTPQASRGENGSGTAVPMLHACIDLPSRPMSSLISMLLRESARAVCHTMACWSCVAAVLLLPGKG